MDKSVGKYVDKFVGGKRFVDILWILKVKVNLRNIYLPISRIYFLLLNVLLNN